MFVCTNLPVAAAPKLTQFHPHLKMLLRGFPRTLSGWTPVTSRLGYSSVTVTFVGQLPFLYVCPWLEDGRIGRQTPTHKYTHHFLKPASRHLAAHGDNSESGLYLCSLSLSCVYTSSVRTYSELKLKLLIYI